MSASEPNPVASEPTDAFTASARKSKLARRIILILIALLVILGVWLVLAYVVLPAVWRHYEHNPALADGPKTTVTAQRIPGDPLNIGLIGFEHSVVRSMLEAGWSPANPITLRSSLRIAASVVLKRPDPSAPVSNLYLFGRRQDLAFEKPVGGSARRRHHVRFWKWVDGGQAGVPLWIGSATFDRSVGFSHLTGQVTHHIAPDIDAERHGLIENLIDAGWVTKIYQVTGVGATIAGRNGGGDRYDTDGELTIGVLGSEAVPGRRPDRLANPPAVRLKAQLWSAIGPLLRVVDPSL
jgi:hypothetical protein